jgi:hypothetical protein
MVPVEDVDEADDDESFGDPGVWRDKSSCSSSRSSKMGGGASGGKRDR